MNTQKSFWRLFAVVITAAIYVAAIAIYNVSHVVAFNPQPDPPAFGMFAITHGQTARLNVVSIPPLAGNTSVEMATVPNQPMVVELTFFDSQGMMLMQSTESLLPGHAAFLDLNGITFERRTEIRARVHVLESPGDPDRNKIKVVATIEVFDNETGKTMVLLPAVQ